MDCTDADGGGWLETVHALSVAGAGGLRHRFAYLCGYRLSAWYRFDADPSGAPVSVGRSSPREIRMALATEPPLISAHLLWQAAEALDEAQAEILARVDLDDPDESLSFWLASRAMQMRRSRLALLDELLCLCVAATVACPADDPARWLALARAQSTARAAIAADYPAHLNVPSDSAAD